MSYIRMIPLQRVWYFLISLTVMTAIGCGGTPSRPTAARPDASKPKPYVHPEPRAVKPHKKAVKNPSLQQQLRSEVRQWQGTPHRMGGDSRRGIDCSGFVHHLYRDILSRKIPRSTALLVKSGRPIGRSQLRTGDLVFFKTPYKGRHVGIYLGRSEFAHASASKGVMISNIEDPFWRRYYWTARRYLNPSKG